MAAMRIIPRKYIFWPGNIIRSIYYNQRGFWLVKNGKLLRCNSEGKVCRSLDETFPLLSNKLELEIPDYQTHEGCITSTWWCWRDVKRGTYPEWDAMNDKEKADYEKHSDEIINDLTIKDQKELAERTAEYEALPAVEKALYRFDWSVRESDSLYSLQTDCRHAARIYNDFFYCLPEAEVRALILKYGKYGYNGELRVSYEEFMWYVRKGLHLLAADQG